MDKEDMTPFYEEGSADWGVGVDNGDDIPDYLEILAAKKRQEKMEDEMIASGKLPPHLLAAQGKLCAIACCFYLQRGY